MMYISKILLLISLLLPSLATAYTPPVGIPDPGDWGTTHPIDADIPDQPGSWPSAEESGYYYIDFDDAGCSDSNTYGYPDVPRCTLPTSFAAGAYVELHGSDSTDRTVTFNGTSASPIWFVSTSTNRATLSGYFLFGTNSQYVIIDGIDWNGGTTADYVGFYNDGINHVAIRNSYVRNKTYVSNNGGIGFNAGPGETINDIILYNITFSELGTWNTTSDEDFHGVTVGCWSGDNTSELYNVWLLDSTGYHLSGNLIQINSGNWPFSYRYTHNIYVGGNTGSASRQAPYWIKKGQDVVFSSNTAYDMSMWGVQGGDGAGFQYAPDRVWWLFNTIHDANFGIRQSDSGTVVSAWTTSTTYYGGDVASIVSHNGHYYEARIGHTSDSTNEPGVGASWETYWGQSPDDSSRDLRENRDVYIIGNLIYDIYPYVDGVADQGERDPGDDYYRYGVGLSLRSGTHNRYVVNNTVYNADDGLIASTQGPLYMANNLFSEIYDITGTPAAWQVDIRQSTSQHTVTDIDYDLFYDSTDGMQLQWNGVTYTTPAAMYSAVSECQHCVEDDPAFTDAANDDYSLTSSSPARDAGTNDPYSVYSTFNTLYGLDITVDINGTDRDGAYDIGAFEYASTVGLGASVFAGCVIGN